jgi:hypothetical protein
MEKKIILTINRKQYPTSYSLIGQTYRVKTDHEDLLKYVTSEFTFRVVNGIGQYLVTSDKTHQIAAQIIKQINVNELKT